MRMSVCALMLILASPAMGEQPAIRFEHHAITLHSGVHSNPTTEFTVPFRDIVSFRGAPWLRVQIGKAELGTRSFIILRSLSNHDEQRLDARALEVWHHRSALFAGDTVEIELHVAPGEQDISVSVDQALEGIWMGQLVTPDRSQCGGTDDRAPTTDTRVGRLYFGGCTAWRTVVGPRLGSADEETCLSAGHCVDFDPDQGGPGLPNGVLDLASSDFVEYNNVPLSTAGGFTNPAPVADQFPVVTTGARWHFEGEGQGLGKDYAVFSVGRNSLGQLPHERYGVIGFRLTRESPAANATVRITGFGADTGTANFTSQTHSGPYVTENSSGANFWHEYQVDTEGGNSGSPIIWSSLNSGLAIGIHTNAGCDPPNGNGNSGTSFEHTPLENDLRDYVRAGANLVKFVDVGHPQRVNDLEGTVFRPFSTVTLGVTNVASGGTVSIVAGSYTALNGNTFTAGTGNKAMTLVAPVGTVTIGN